MKRSTSSSQSRGSTRSDGGGSASAAASASALAGRAGRDGARTTAGPFAEPVGPVDDAVEREAHRVADVVARGGVALAGGRAWSAASAPGGVIRRAPMEADAGAGVDAAPAAAPPVAAPPMPSAEPERDEAPEAKAAAPAAAAGKAPILIVDDDGEVTRGQMRKTEFLAMLRVEVCAAVDAGLAGTGRDAQGCPFLDHWFGYYAERTPSQIERAMRRYAPEANAATSARDYVRAVLVRVRRSVATWVKTGELSGLPDDIPGMPMAGGGLLAAFGGMFFKARPGGARRADPASVRDELGAGQRLPGDVRGRMESAFGTSFGDVRLHTDAAGARVSQRLNARAFTVGEHVAFGAGEFRPGTLVGDALIAHELAHVVQQGGASASGVLAKSPDGSGRIEDDADRSAVAVVSSLWDASSTFTRGVRANAVPRLRSGLALSRCKSEEEKAHDREVGRLGDLQYGFLEDKRKAQEAQAKKDAEDEAAKKGLPPPATAPKVDLSDVVKKDVDKHALKGSPTTPWDTADQPAWKKRAAKAWKDVVASVKGTELESIAKGVHFNFDPAEALKGGFYAEQSDHTLTVGMSWVLFAEADPKNVWENLAHEMAGHLQYADTYAEEIMKAALSRLSRSERKRVIGDKQKFFEAYEYPETEIYASLWQRRYRVPETGPVRPSGGIHPDVNIAKRLNVMKDALHPEVALAVLKELKRRVDANDQILQRDKDFFVQQVKVVFGISL
jgi:hypothetical protein